jgi:sigma-B regulation protein RsbU (phosphoserine phosphatase)
MNTPKILIVDDKPQNLFALEKTLKKLNVDVRQATSGNEALGLVLKQDFALAIVDVQMPEMDGYELVELLRGNPKTGCLPIIFVSAIYSDEYHHRKGYDAGAVDFLSKPFNPEILLSKVRVFLDLYHQRVELENLVDQRDKANAKIQDLNQQLESENVRMEAELDVTRRLQQMLLPTTEELKQIEALDIAGYMEPADEVGGDFYDVLQQNGYIKIGIGDVTGHGLESGVVMLMLQAAIRTLLTSGETDPVRFMDVINRTIYGNVQRMNVEKSLTLALLDYQEGQIKVSGQHENVIIVRGNGEVELTSTIDLGFPVGLVPDITAYVQDVTLELATGDGIVVYSDGITEAESETGKLYGLERLCTAVGAVWEQPAEQIKEAVVADVRQFMGHSKLLDDLTLLVVKQQ